MALTDIKWVTFEWTKGSQMFNQMIIASVDQQDLSNINENYKNMLYFTDTTIFWQNDLYSTIRPSNGLDKVTETQKAPEFARNLWNSKGIYQELFRNKITVTWLFYKWLRTTKTLKWASPEVQGNIFKTWRNMTDLMNAGRRTQAQLLTRVLTQGTLSNAANWPWSLTPDWQPLFSTSHPIASLGTTQSNIVTWAFTTDADRITALTTAVNRLRQMRLANGDWVSTTAWSSSPYVLKVSITEKLAWMRALNNLKQYSGTGSNANTVNIFTVSDFEVVIEELPMLWTYDKDGIMIGDTTACYLMNPVYLRETEALRCYEISPMEVRTYEEEDPSAFITQVEMLFGADHYGAELWIVKLTGQA